jgi:hypothetical protein
MPLSDGKQQRLKLAPKMGKLLFDKTKKWRYRVAHGGRGSSKSWGFADAAIELAVRFPMRILCTRQIQNTIRDSIHQLLSDRIQALGYSKYFEVVENEIRSSAGAKFIFRGLLRNITEIKSMEGIDLCLVCEAQDVTDECWDLLTPTIRKEDSEIWIEFNPHYEDDATYKRFIVNKPDNAIVTQINYPDNPFFPDVLQIEMEQDRALHGEKSAYFRWKWGGEPLGAGSKIWTAFDSSLIKTFPWDIVAKRGNAVMSMDPHSHYYPFCLWMSIIPKNERLKWPEDFYKWVYAEWPTYEDLHGYYHDMRKTLQFTGSLLDLSKQIYNHDGTGQHGIKIYKRFIDTRYAKGSGSWNWSSATTGIIDLFAKPENGAMNFDLPQEKIIDAQRQAVHSDMLYNKLFDKTVFNEPAFYVAPWCKNTIASLENHRLIEGSETEDEKYKEPSDCIRIAYAGTQNWQYDNASKRAEDIFSVGSFGQSVSAFSMFGK